MFDIIKHIIYFDLLPPCEKNTIVYFVRGWRPMSFDAKISGGFDAASTIIKTDDTYILHIYIYYTNTQSFSIVYRKITLIVDQSRV